MICNDQESFNVGYKQAMDVAATFYGNEIKKIEERLNMYERRCKIYENKLSEQEGNEKYIELGKALMTIIKVIKDE